MPEFLRDILIEFIAAFLGFLSALVLNGMSERRSDEKRNEMILDSLYDELVDIVGSLKDYIDHGTELRYQIATPSWDAVQYAGATINLLGRDCYNDLLRTFATISTYNQVFREQTAQKNVAMLRAITESAEAVINVIDEERAEK